MKKKIWIEFDNQEINNNFMEKDIISEKISKISIQKQKKGKKGKTITHIKGLGLTNDSNLRNLLKKMKVFCGTGGTLVEKDIQLQGDMVTKSIEFLRQEGFQI
tara:strand:- start:184 stop:492 length:309 start_codon:yes stop_codon:yes gene_type:complete